jgi:hypothetical protein
MKELYLYQRKEKGIYIYTGVLSLYSVREILLMPFYTLCFIV